MIPPMKSNTGTSAFLSALVEQPPKQPQAPTLSQDDADKQSREVMQFMIGTENAHM